jgi:hypothetical protein
MGKFQNTRVVQTWSFDLVMGKRYLLGFEYMLFPKGSCAESLISGVAVSGIS